MLRRLLFIMLIAETNVLYLYQYTMILKGVQQDEKNIIWGHDAFIIHKYGSRHACKILVFYSLIYRLSRAVPYFVALEIIALLMYMIYKYSIRSAK